MSYEIPQQLEYKEKIIFGLTFKQLVYAIIFLPIALALLFKTSFSFPVRITISLIPTAIAALFMFTNLPTEMKNCLKWLKYRNIPLTDKNNNLNPAMKKLLPVEKIAGGVLYLT